jgi:hypothetical protein
MPGERGRVDRRGRVYSADLVLLIAGFVVLTSQALDQKDKAHAAGAGTGGNASMVLVSSKTGQLSLGKHAALLEMTRHTPEKKTRNSTGLG